MESNKTEEARMTEHFDFGTSSVDLFSSAGKRNVRNEISNKGFDPEIVIDAFETAKGIKRPGKGVNTAPDLTFKNIILDPEQQRDQDMLNELLNSKKYVIAMWKDTWTPQGNFRVFIVYGTRKEKESEGKK